MSLISILAFVVFLIGFLVALAGVILPVLPGVPVAGVAALLSAWMIGFQRFGVAPLVYVVGLTVLSFVLDFVGNLVGTKVYGAGKAGMWGGIIGSVVGIFFFPPFGFLLGALVGAAAFELLAGRAADEALRAGVGAFIGALGGTVAKVFIVIAMGVVVFPRFF